jgi:hypothetical protein
LTAHDSVFLSTQVEELIQPQRSDKVDAARGAEDGPLKPVDFCLPVGPVFSLVDGIFHFCLSYCHHITEIDSVS